MQLSFTKMQGAGNDFVVIDATRQPFELGPAQLRRLGDRRFGVGCDQVLVVPALDGHGFDVVFERTSRLSKAEMADLIDFIQAWDAQT